MSNHILIPMPASGDIYSIKDGSKIIKKDGVCYRVRGDNPQRPGLPPDTKEISASSKHLVVMDKFINKDGKSSGYQSLDPLDHQILTGEEMKNTYTIEEDYPLKSIPDLFGRYHLFGPGEDYGVVAYKKDDKFVIFATCWRYPNSVYRQLSTLPIDKHEVEKIVGRLNVYDSTEVKESVTHKISIDFEENDLYDLAKKIYSGDQLTTTYGFYQDDSLSIMIFKKLMKKLGYKILSQYTEIESETKKEMTEFRTNKLWSLEKFKEHFGN